MTNIIKYDAFTGMNYSKKTALVDFLCTINEVPTSEKEKITKAVDYAIKDTASFGGFIVALEKAHKFIGAVVINKSGMGGLLPGNLVVAHGVASVLPQEEVIALLLKEADKYAKGDIAIVSKAKSSNEVQLISLTDNNVKYLNDNTLRERVIREIA